MLAVLVLPDWDCNRCTAQQKRVRGCFTDSPTPMKFDGERVKRCPRRPLLEEPDRYASIFAAYRSYMKGQFPDPGPLHAQAHPFVVYMQIVEDAVAEAEKDRERREHLAGARKNALSSSRG